MNFTVGSLFDGSGGFPLAASLCGGVPVWAAEIEPYPIAVTRSRFPGMKHLGSVTDINGGEIDPVDVITFGSPCQDLSVAGKRAGLKHEDNGDDETTRSGLFMEAVRIIREMRQTTNGRYPRFALWENVPGAFSSNKGEDFRIVLEELIKIVEPTAVMPSVPKSGWAYADSYVGDGWSLAYRVFDAQFWGVPQRRRRIYLVVDFADECAGKVLFECESLRGYFETCGTPGQTVAGDVADCAGAADRTGAFGYDGYNSDVTGDKAATLGVNCGMSTGRNGVCVPYFQPVAYSFDSLASNSMKSSNPHSGCREVEVAKTLDTTDPNPCKNQGGIAIVQLVAFAQNQRDEVRDLNGKAGALMAEPGMKQQTFICMATDQHILDDQGGSQISVRTDGKSPTLRAEMHGNVPCVLRPAEADQYVLFEPRSQDGVCRIHGEVSPTLNTAQGGQRQPCVVYCLQGNGIDRADTAGCNGAGWREGASYTLNTIDRPAVVYACSSKQQSLAVSENCGNTLGANDYKEPQVVAYKVPVRYIVRRLTPTECARLQGFADGWGIPDSKTEFSDEEYRFWLNVRNTHAAINGKAVKDYTPDQMLTWYNKLHTDSSEYKMWGNGIALPTALYCMQGIAEHI